MRNFTPQHPGNKIFIYLDSPDLEDITIILSRFLSNWGWDFYVGCELETAKISVLNKPSLQNKVIPYPPGLSIKHYVSSLKQLGIKYSVALTQERSISRQWSMIIGSVVQHAVNFGFKFDKRFQTETESFPKLSHIDTFGISKHCTSTAKSSLLNQEFNHENISHIAELVSTLFVSHCEYQAFWIERKLSFQRSIFRNVPQTATGHSESNNRNYLDNAEVIYLCMNASFGEAATPGTYGLISEVAKTRRVLVLCPPPTGNIVFFNNEIEIRYVDVANYRRDISQLAESSSKLIREPLLTHQPAILHIIGIHGASLVPKIRDWGYQGKIILDIRTPTISTNRDLLRRHALRLMTAQFFTDAFVFGSVGARDREMPNSFKPVSIISPGILLDQFESRSSLPLNINKFIYVGNIAKSRQLDVLIDQFAFHLKNFTNDRLDFFGDGNDVKQLKTKVKRLGLKNKINFLGRVEQSILNKKMAEYDAGVAYVPDLEHFGVSPSLKAMEYIAAGIPVIASDTLGHRNFISETGAKMFLFSDAVESFSSAAGQCREYIFTDEYKSRQLKVVHQVSYKSIVDKMVLPLYETLSEY